MGAELDVRQGHGPDVRSAFRAAQEDARYSHGHDGYTGTIAEKGDVVLVALPPRMTAGGLLALAESYGYAADEARWAREALADHRRLGVGARKTYGGRTLKQAEADVARLERVAAREEKKIPAHAVAAAKKVAAVALGDKRGPAVAIDVSAKEARAYKERHGLVGRRNVNVYVFAGTCSS